MKDSDFIYPDTTKNPALLGEDVIIRQTPQDICGGYADLLKRHYIAQMDCENDEQRDKALKRAGISYEDRQLVAGLQQGLRDHGYYITGADPNGRLELSIVTDSMHEHFKNLDPVEPLTRQKVRDLYLKLKKGQLFNMPTVTKAEIEEERDKF